MPRIKGVGELDWWFPEPSEIAVDSCYQLKTKLELISPLAVVGREEVVFRDGKIHFIYDRVNSAYLKSVVVLPPQLIAICRKLSEEFPEVILLAWESSFVYLDIKVKQSAPSIRYPTKFIESLARKMSKWAAEWRRSQALIIDCDAQPSIPDGFSLTGEGTEHRRGGQFIWKPANISLFLTDGQKNGGVIRGHELRKLLKKKAVLNANVLDFLLANPHLIPEEWKGKDVFFWGTIYRDSHDYLYVRHLFFDGYRWRSRGVWLDGSWLGEDPAALCAR